MRAGDSWQRRSLLVWLLLLSLFSLPVTVTCFSSQRFIRPGIPTGNYRRRHHIQTKHESLPVAFGRTAVGTANRVLIISRKAAIDDLDLGAGFSLVPLLVIIALGLGFAAQGWINQQLEGDQGLGAFLKDGQGFKKSGFRPLMDGDRAASNDPLPWLSLPNLDFVEVAGQSSAESKIMAELEDLRMEMNQQLERGNLAEANAIRAKLETLMRENGFEFQAEE